MLTITSQRHAWRRAAFYAVEPTALATCPAMTLASAPAYADEGDIVVQHGVIPCVAYRGVQTDALPIRVAAGPFPIQAFNQSVGPVMSMLFSDELGASRAASDNAATDLQHALVSSTGTGLQPTTGGLSVGNAVSGAAVGGVDGQVVQTMVGIASQISGALTPLSRGGQP